MDTYTHNNKPGPIRRYLIRVDDHTCFLLRNGPVVWQGREWLGRHSDPLKRVKTRPADPQQTPSGAHTLSALPLPVCTTSSCYCAPTMPTPIANNSFFLYHLFKNNIWIYLSIDHENRKGLGLCSIIHQPGTNASAAHNWNVLFLYDALSSSLQNTPSCSPVLFSVAMLKEMQRGNKQHGSG